MSDMDSVLKGQTIVSNVRRLSDITYYNVRRLSDITLLLFRGIALYCIVGSILLISVVVGNYCLGMGGGGARFVKIAKICSKIVITKR